MASPLGGMSVMVFPSGSFARLGILGWVSRVVEDAYCIMRRWKPLLLNSTDGPAGSRLRLWQGQGHDHAWVIKRIKNRSLLLARAKIGIVQQNVSEIWLR